MMTRALDVKFPEFESVMKKVNFIAKFVHHFSWCLMRNVNIKLTIPNLLTTQAFYDIKS